MEVAGVIIRRIVNINGLRGRFLLGKHELDKAFEIIAGRTTGMCCPP